MNPCRGHAFPLNRAALAKAGRKRVPCIMAIISNKPSRGRLESQAHGRQLSPWTKKQFQHPLFCLFGVKYGYLMFLRQVYLAPSLRSSQYTPTFCHPFLIDASLMYTPFPLPPSSDCWTFSANACNRISRCNSTSMGYRRGIHAPCR